MAVLAAAATILFGLWPNPLFDAARDIGTSLGGLFLWAVSLGRPALDLSPSRWRSSVRSWACLCWYRVAVGLHRGHQLLEVGVQDVLLVLSALIVIGVAAAAFVSPGSASAAGFDRSDRRPDRPRTQGRGAREGSDPGHRQRPAGGSWRCSPPLLVGSLVLRLVDLAPRQGAFLCWRSSGWACSRSSAWCSPWSSSCRSRQHLGLGDLHRRRRPTCADRAGDGGHGPGGDPPAPVRGAHRGRVRSAATRPRTTWSPPSRRWRRTRTEPSPSSPSCCSRRWGSPPLRS